MSIRNQHRTRKRKHAFTCTDPSIVLPMARIASADDAKQSDLLPETDDLGAEPISITATATPAVPVPDADDYETWNDKSLMERARMRITQSDRHDAKRIALGRMSIEDRLDAGHVLSIVRRRHKDDRKWCAMQDEYSLARTTVWEVIAVYERLAARGHSKQDVAANHEMWGDVLVTYDIPTKRKPKRQAVQAKADAEAPPVPPCRPTAPDQPHGEPIPAVPAPRQRQSRIEDNLNSGEAGDNPEDADLPDDDENDQQERVERAWAMLCEIGEKGANITACDRKAFAVFAKAVGDKDRAVRVAIASVWDTL